MTLYMKNNVDCISSSIYKPTHVSLIESANNKCVFAEGRLLLATATTNVSFLLFFPFLALEHYTIISPVYRIGICVQMYKYTNA